MAESCAQCKLTGDGDLLVEHMREELVKMEKVLQHRMKTEKDVASVSNNL